MPSILESQFLLALARNELLSAHELLGQLRHECPEAHFRVLRAHFKAHLSVRNYPEAFAEMMEVAALSDPPLWTELFTYIEGSRLALLLFDIGRMRQVLRLFKGLKTRYLDHPDVIMWTGPILLNQANLAAQIGAADAISLYRAAAKSLGEYERFWCLAIAANSRLAIVCQEDGRPAEADKALARAEGLLRNETNRQEVLLARARILLSRTRPSDALTAATESWLLAKQAGDQYIEVLALQCCGEALRSLGRVAEALPCFVEAREVAMAHHMYYLLDAPRMAAHA